MKLLLSLIFFTSLLFANYQNQEKGKIDMHGGKGDSLLSGKSDISKPSIKPLSGISIDKPSSPFGPKTLIKKENKKIQTK